MDLFNKSKADFNLIENKNEWFSMWKGKLGRKTNMS